MFFLVLTWSNAIHDRKERISIPPAWTKIIDLNTKLLRNLGLDPLQQGFLGANLPFFLSFSADASFAN